MVRDKITGQSLGFGSVSCSEPDDADEAAHTLNGLELQAKTVKILPGIAPATCRVPGPLQVGGGGSPAVRGPGSENETGP